MSVTIGDIGGDVIGSVITGRDTPLSAVMVILNKDDFAPDVALVNLGVRHLPDSVNNIGLVVVAWQGQMRVMRNRFGYTGYVSVGELGEILSLYLLR